MRRNKKSALDLHTASVASPAEQSGSLAAGQRHMIAITSFPPDAPIALRQPFNVYVESYPPYGWLCTSNHASAGGIGHTPQAAVTRYLHAVGERMGNLMIHEDVLAPALADELKTLRRYIIFK